MSNIEVCVPTAVLCRQDFCLVEALWLQNQLLKLQVRKSLNDHLRAEQRHLVTIERWLTSRHKVEILCQNMKGNLAHALVGLHKQHRQRSNMMQMAFIALIVYNIGFMLAVYNTGPMLTVINAIHDWCTV
jgi:hypothetical protein